MCTAVVLDDNTAAETRNQKKSETLRNKETANWVCQEADMDTDITVEGLLSVFAKCIEPWERGHGERSSYKVKRKPLLDDTDTFFFHYARGLAEIL